jgi:hypothetical protein
MLENRLLIFILLTSVIFSSPESYRDRYASIMIRPSTSQSFIALQNNPAIRYTSKSTPSKRRKALQLSKPEDAVKCLSLDDHCFYWDTQPPRRAQLEYADQFFTPSGHSPLKLWSASKFRTIPFSDMPEVAFFGRSNVGKSSLLNALMGRKLCWTSSKPGRTREMNAFGIGGTKGGESKVVLMDMPGYGKGSREEWGGEIIKYLTRRKQSVWFPGIAIVSISMSRFCTAFSRDLHYPFHSPEDYKANRCYFSASDCEEPSY